MLYHDMLPRITTAPTPIPTFCHVFIALASGPSPYGWDYPITNPYVWPSQNVSGIRRVRRDKESPIYRFSEFYASLRLRARVTVPTTASDRVQFGHACGQYGCVPCWAILDAFKVERNSVDRIRQAIAKRTGNPIWANVLILVYVSG